MATGHAIANCAFFRAHLPSQSLTNLPSNRQPAALPAAIFFLPSLPPVALLNRPNPHAPGLNNARPRGMAQSVRSNSCCQPFILHTLPNVLRH